MGDREGTPFEPLRSDVVPGPDVVAGPGVVAWLLASDEPWTRWLTLTALLDRGPDDPDVVAAHHAVVTDPRTRGLIARLPDWEAPSQASGHDSPAFTPNLLALLADMGLVRGDAAAVDALIEVMLAHQQEDGRFASFAAGPGTATPQWGSLLCDAHAIVDVLIRFGRGDDPRVAAALDRVVSDLSVTAQGAGWTCIPSIGFRGPGRVGDLCPQVTIEAVRALGHGVDDSAAARAAERRRIAIAAGRTVLALWRERGTVKPYMFGHGFTFKTVKWPPFWYSVLSVLDALSLYPEIWTGSEAQEEDRRSLAELAACLLAYNLDDSGCVTPRSCYRGFEGFSFGQRKEPSPFATAVVAVVLRRLADLAGEIRGVDVATLGSSRGGTGRARPPKGWPTRLTAPNA